MEDKRIFAVVVKILMPVSLVYPTATSQIKSGDVEIVEAGIGETISGLLHRIVDSIKRLLGRTPVPEEMIEGVVKS